MRDKILLVVMAAVGLFVIRIGGRQPEWMGLSIIIFGLALFFIGGIFAAGGWRNFFMGLAVIFCMYFLFIAGEHLGWWGPWPTFFTVTRRGYHGNGDFLPALFLAAVLGVGVYALLCLPRGKKSEGEKKTGHKT